ncbi:hypothetical protein Landi51_08311 [Colletotrichum acutatum]
MKKHRRHPPVPPRSWRPQIVQSLTSQRLQAVCESDVISGDRSKVDILLRSAVHRHAAALCYAGRQPVDESLQQLVATSDALIAADGDGDDQIRWNLSRICHSASVE